VVEELYTPEQLAQMHDSLWQCVLQFANVSAAQERNRIARDLHDSLGHALTALNFQLQTAMKCKAGANQAKILTEAHELVKIATKEMRESVKALRSDAIETQSLEELIHSLVQDFESTTGISPTVYIDFSVKLPSHLVAPLYRITQEALNNIRKYAQATEIQIYACTTSTGAYLIIKDNGRGFNSQEVSGGYGLQGMQERVAVLQGRFDVESQPKEGCCISVGIPLHISQVSSEFNQTPSLNNTYNTSSNTTEIDLPTTVIHQEYQSSTHNQTSEEVTKHPAVDIGEWQPLDLSD
jgi:signal transduction histidine kinase